MTDLTSVPEPNAESERRAPELDMDALTRKADRNRYRVPRLEDLLNDTDDFDGVYDDADDAAEARPSSEDFIEPLVKPKRMPGRKSMRSRTGISDVERRWATIAHASVLLTLFVGLPSAGFLTLITLFIPLGIYFYWRQKSEFVAFQALQAFTLQVLGTVGWLAILTVGMVVGALLLIILAITLVGLILYPIVIPAMILFALATFALPFGMVVYSIIAAMRTWQGVDYRLPRIGRWIDNQMHSGFLEH